jgi:hypothetical protein
MSKNLEKIQKENADLMVKPLYKEMYNKLVNSWIHPEQTVEELKNIAKDLYHNKIFSDRHLGKEYHMLQSVFMVMMFMKQNIEWDLESREGKIIHLLLQDLEKEHDKRRDGYYNNIGFIYEYLDKANPMAINGFPTFFSCRFLTKTDTDRMFEYYEKYKDIQEKINDQL